MPDEREKLIELIRCADFHPCKGTVTTIGSRFNTEFIEDIADYLISNGVTVQEWIPVTERLPTIHDADADNCVLAIHKASNKRYYHWRTVVDNPFDFTFWSKVPEPPKED